MSRTRRNSESGAILIIFMVALVVAAIALGAVVQSWSTTWRRDKEKELIFRGNQYVDAIIAYRKEHGGQFPLTLEDLYKPGPRRLRYIRQLYREPIAQDGKWGLLYLMPGGQGVYDPKTAQKAQEKAAKDWSSNWETAGTGALAQPQVPGVTPINQNQFGGGVPGIVGAPPGASPGVAIQGNLPPIPSEQPGGIAEGKEPVSEPPIGWPIVGVVSRATGKLAEDTYKIYKGHEHVDEWQFQVFDRGEQMQQPPGAPGGPTAPAGMGMGFGGKYQIQGVGGAGGMSGPGGRMWNNGPRPGGGQNQMFPPQRPGNFGGQLPQGPPGQYPQGGNPGQPYPGDEGP